MKRKNKNLLHSVLIAQQSHLTSQSIFRPVCLIIVLLCLAAIPFSHLANSNPIKRNRTPLEYARQCEKHLGPIPRFSCGDALPIPITQKGKRVSKDVGWCDRPAAFNAPCTVDNRVGLIKGMHPNGKPRPEVVFVTFCRGTRDGGMGVIGHNRKTGATCFFEIDDFREKRVDGRGLLPGPNDPDYDKVWGSPQEVALSGCANCHMADPFLHTPWIDQVRDPKNPDQPLVPLIASPDSPYFVVGEEFSQPPGRKGDQKLASVPKELEGSTCVECHRPQCLPDFFNIKLDELAMPAPFDDIHKTMDPTSVADREELRKWCKSLKIRYFPNFDDDEDGYEEANDEEFEK